MYFLSRSRNDSSPLLAMTRLLLIFSCVGLIAPSLGLVTNFAGSSAVGKVGRVSAGPIEISSLGCGTWSWCVYFHTCNAIVFGPGLRIMHIIFFILAEAAKTSFFNARFPTSFIFQCFHLHFGFRIKPYENPLTTNRGNKLLWDYDPSQDEEIYRAYRAVRDAGVTIFDTADSYGTCYTYFAKQFAFDRSTSSITV